MSRADPVPPFDLSIQMTFNLNIEIKYQAHNASLQDFARLRDNILEAVVIRAIGLILRRVPSGIVYGAR